MTEENNIDKLFREAAKNYSVSTPEGAVRRMHAALKARRRRRLLWWWFAGLVVLLLSAFLIFSLCGNRENTRPRNNKIENKSTTPKVEKQQNESERKATEHGKAAGTVSPQKVQRAKTAKKIEQRPQTGLNSANKNSSQQEENQANVRQSKQASPKINRRKGKALQQSKLPEKELEFDKTSSPPRNEKNTADAAAKKDSLPQQNVAGEPPADSVQVVTTTAGNSLGDNTKASEKSVGDTTSSAKFKPVIYLAAGLNSGLSGGFAGHNGPQFETSAAYVGNRPGFSVSPQLSLQLVFSPSFYFSAGFSILKVFSKSDFRIIPDKLNYINGENFGYTAAGLYSLGDIDKIMKENGFNHPDDLRNFKNISTIVNLNTAFLNVGYYVKKGKWQLSANGGFAFAAVGKNKVETSLEDGSRTDFGRMSALRSFLFGTDVGARLLHTGSKSLFWGFDTQAVFFLNSLNSSRDFGFYPYNISFGPVIGLSF